MTQATEALRLTPWRGWFDEIHSPTPEMRQVRYEVSEFYWNTDLSAREIGEHYGILPTEVWRYCIPNILVTPWDEPDLGIAWCPGCDGPVDARSRSELEAWEAWVEERQALEPLPWGAYEGDLCRECQKELAQERQEERAAKAETASTGRERARVVAIKALQVLPYREYLMTDHWDGIRKDALRRAGYRCSTCNASVPLHVHHRTYENLGREKASDVIALCAPCHSKFHGKYEPADGGVIMTDMGGS